MPEQPVPTVPVETLDGVVYATTGEARELRRRARTDMLQAVATMCAELWPWQTLLTFVAAVAGLFLATAASPDPVRPKPRPKTRRRRR